MWYYARNGKQGGPVSETSLRAMLTSGSLTPADLVWQEGMPEWRTVADAFDSPAHPSAAHPPPPHHDPIPYATPASGHSRPAVEIGYRDRAADLHANRHYAGFWIRFRAKIVDFVVLWVGTYLIDIALGKSGFRDILIYWLYEALFLSRLGATPGKLAVGLRVQTEEGLPLSFWRATGRHIGEYLSAFIFFIGYFMVIFTDRRRALHDLLAGTIVVRTR